MKRECVRAESPAGKPPGAAPGAEGCPVARAAPDHTLPQPPAQPARLLESGGQEVHGVGRPRGSSGPRGAPSPCLVMVSQAGWREAQTCCSGHTCELCQRPQLARPLSGFWEAQSPSPGRHLQASPRSPPTRRGGLSTPCRRPGQPACPSLAPGDACGSHQGQRRLPEDRLGERGGPVG